MTKEEFKPIAKTLRLTYANSKMFTTIDMYQEWFRLLQDLDAETLTEATDNYIKANEYAPTIAGLRNECAKIDKHKADINRELRIIYDRTRGIYPNSEDDKDTVKAWWSLITQKPLDDRIPYALHIESVTLRYVRAIEASDRTEIPTLTEFFKGAR